MLVFRSLALGLVGGCFLMLASRPTYVVRFAREPPPPAWELPPSATIVDVAPDLTASQLAGLVHLRADEHVAMVDDAAVTGSLDAGTVIAGLDLRGRRYVDLTVAGDAGTRRVLVLLH